MSSSSSNSSKVKKSLDIPFIEKLKWKKEWLQKEYPDEFGPSRWNFDVDKLFSKEE